MQVEISKTVLRLALLFLKGQFINILKVVFYIKILHSSCCCIQSLHPLIVLIVAFLSNKIFLALNTCLKMGSCGSQKSYMLWNMVLQSIHRDRKTSGVLFFDNCY